MRLEIERFKILGFQRINYIVDRHEDNTIYRGVFDVNVWMVWSWKDKQPRLALDVQNYDFVFIISKNAGMRCRFCNHRRTRTPFSSGLQFVNVIEFYSWGTLPCGSPHERLIKISRLKDWNLGYQKFKRNIFAKSQILNLFLNWIIKIKNILFKFIYKLSYFIL